MKFFERLRRLDDRVLGPAPPGPAWPRLAGVAAWLTVVTMRMAFDAVAESDATWAVLGGVLAVVCVAWLAVSTREAFRRRVVGVSPGFAGLLWVAAGGLQLVFDYEHRPAAFFVLNGLLVAIGLGIEVAVLRRHREGGPAPSIDLT
ncbi:MAG TPA: hypothetical protein VNQ77_04715 [Frankiaceae bacterium]|nr:hypothetical protein [Frankiaceae bacterium]